MGFGDGNGWVYCRCGRRHWGRHGAAGLMLTRSTCDGVPRRRALEVLLQLRAAWTHEGGTWGLPGGARDSHEAAEEAAVREAWEETGVPPGAVDVVASVVSTDHGDWCYTVVIGRAREPVQARPANSESDQVRWVPISDVDRLPLHPGLADSWSGLLSEVPDMR